MNTIKNKTIRFKTVQTPVSPLLPGVVNYRAIVINNETKKIKEIADDMFASGCNCQPATIRYVLQFFADNIPGMIAGDGCRRSLGDLVTFYPAIGGLFDTPDADADETGNPVEIRATTPAVTRKALVGVRLYNITDTDINPTISVEYDVGSAAADTVIVNSAARFNGKDLLLVAGREDEGVWISNSDGSVSMKMTVTENTPWNIGFITPEGTSAAALPAGDYTLTLKTRAGRDAEMKLYELTRAVRVVANA